MPNILAEPIMVGREQELKQLLLSLDSASECRGTTVVVSGEAGTGKTRLINEFLTTAKKKDIALLTGWCLSNVTVPYFPFIEAFDSYLAKGNKEGKSGASKIFGIKTRLSEPRQLESLTDTVKPQAWKDQAFAAVAQEFLNISSCKTTVVVLEDVHWADSASLLLLHYISRSLSSQRILIVATFRSEELNVDAAGHPHPLTEILRLMRRENLLKEINLAPLSQLNIGEIAESMLDGKVQVELVEKLTKESQGNPLFIVESLRMLREHGDLVQQKKQWRLSVDNIGIPPKVKDVILRRLDNLKQDERRILDLASVIGDKFNPVLLGTIVDEDILKILETLNSVMHSTSLVCVEGDSYWFDHSKSREVLYEEIPLPLKNGYHERIAEKIESSGQIGGSLPLSDLAYHYAQAGNREKAVKYALAAGKDALSRFSNTEAAKHFNYVIDTRSDEPKYVAERTEALEGLGDSLFARSLFEEATKVFEQVSHSTESNAAKLRAIRKAMASSRWRGDLVHSLELASTAQDLAHSDRLEYGRVRMLRGIASGLRGNVREGTMDLEDASRVFEEEYSLSDLAAALRDLASFYVSDFQVEKALRLVMRSVALGEDLKDFREQMETHFIAGNIFFNCLLYKEALDSYKKAIEVGKKIGDYNTLGWAYIYSGILLESIADFGEAISITLKGKELSEKTDAFYIQSMAYANLAIQYSRIGDLNHAEEYSEKFMKFFTEISQTGSKVAKGAAVRAKAVFLAAKGQYQEAYSLFEESIQLHKSAVYPRLYEMITRVEYAWALSKEGRVEESGKQSNQAKKLSVELDQKLMNSEVQADLVAPKKIGVDEEFNLRLDIENVTKASVILVRIDGLVPPEFRVTVFPSGYKLQDMSVNLGEKKLNPYQIEPLKISLKATKTGMFNLNPRVAYLDKEQKAKLCMPKPVKLIVKSANPVSEVENLNPTAGTEFEFKNQASKDAFNFLTVAFIEDYMRRRLPSELAGWRTLMEIVKHGRMSRRMVYGNGGYRGRAIAELERRGLVEIRIFPGERGRGGRIVKVRVFYEKDVVRRHLDDRVMKVGKNKEDQK